MARLTSGREWATGTPRRRAACRIARSRACRSRWSYRPRRSRQLVTLRVPELWEPVKQDDRRTLASLHKVEPDTAIDLDAAFTKAELLGQRGHRRGGRSTRRRQRVRLCARGLQKVLSTTSGWNSSEAVPTMCSTRMNACATTRSETAASFTRSRYLCISPVRGSVALRPSSDSEVFAGSQDPRGDQRLRQPSLELLRGCFVHQPSAEDERVLAGDGHALAIDRVEAARAVAGDDETVRPGPERVVMPEPVLRPTIGRDARDGTVSRMAS